MSKGLTTRELSRLLGISTSTLRIWEDVLQLPVPRDDQNHRRYPPDLVVTLTSVARLRQAGQDYASIAKELRLDSGTADHETPAGAGEAAHETRAGKTAVEPPPTSTEPAAAPADKVIGRPLETLPETVTPTVLAKDHPDLLTAYTRLSEDHRNLAARYAEATFAIGQLEERVHNLTQQLVEAETQLAKYELAPPQPLALPEPAEPTAAAEALRDLESQVHMLALAMISQRPLTVWERFNLWLKG